MKPIQTIALVAVLGLAPTVGFAVNEAEVVADDAAEAKTIEYVAGMTGVT